MATSAGAELISGGVKIYIDGSGTARTAWMYEDWNENFTDIDEGNTGLTYLEPNLLFDQVRLFHDAGIHIGTHAIGDRAIDFIMDAYDRVLADNPAGWAPAQHHSLQPADRSRDGPHGETSGRVRRGLSGSTAGVPVVDRRRLCGQLSVLNEACGVLPLRTFEERGIKWAGASDFDVSPYAPRYALWAASTRESMLGTHGDNPWGTDESVSVHETLRAYTATAARQVFLEDKVGSIEVGKLADIVAWDRDLYAIPAAELKEVRPAYSR